MFKLRDGISFQKINLKNLSNFIFRHKYSFNYLNKFSKFSISNIIDKEAYKSNKNFAAKFRDTQEFHYLHNINLMNLLNSMFVLRRNFETIVFLGSNPDIFLEKIPQNITPNTFIYCDISEDNLKISKNKIDSFRSAEMENKNPRQNLKNLPQNIFPVLINQDKWPFKENSINCIINNLSLHNVENLEDYLKLMNNSLVPDGCLLSNFFCNETFNELKFVLNLAENEREGGISPNVVPLLQISDMGNLLHKLKYTLPSFNVNKYRYKFYDLSHLLEFLKIMGETNFLKNRRLFKRKDTYISAMALYQSLFNNTRIINESDDFMDYRIIDLDFRTISNKNNFKNEGEIKIEQGQNENFTGNQNENRNNNGKYYVYATVDIATFITWKYHPSQQKPKERGTAEFSLKELATDILEADKDNEIRFGKIDLKKGLGNEDEFEIVEMTDLIKEKIKKKLGEEVVEEKLKNVNVEKEEENKNENNKK